MDVNQVYSFVNTATQEAIGESAVVSEDLSNIVDIGTAIFNANAVDAYVRSLVNHVGLCVFVNRPYRGGIPSLMMSSWEFGSVLEKVTMDKLPEAQENEEWQLVDGASYDPFIFKQPKISAKFYNNRVTFEIQMSFTERQVKQSFSNVDQLNSFISMIYTAIENSMTVKTDELIMRTVDDMIAQTLYNEYNGSGYGADSKTKAVNLLYLYNQTVPTPITVAEAMVSPEFIRFASYIMNVYAARMRKMSTLFNMGGKERFTPDDRRITVLHADFVAAAKSFLYSGTFHDKFVALPDGYEEVAYWQGSGTSFDFSDTSALDVVTVNGDTVQIDGIIGVMFDRDAVAVTNYERRVTSVYAPKGDFYNNWFRATMGLFEDPNENMVVFFIKASS